MVLLSENFVVLSGPSVLSCFSAGFHTCVLNLRHSVTPHEKGALLDNRRARVCEYVLCSNLLSAEIVCLFLHALRDKHREYRDVVEQQTTRITCIAIREASRLQNSTLRPI